MMAMDLSPHKIRVNAVAPGSTLSEQVLAVDSAYTISEIAGEAIEPWKLRSPPTDRHRPVWWSP